MDILILNLLSEPIFELGISQTENTQIRVISNFLCKAKYITSLGKLLNIGCSKNEDHKHAFLYCWPIVSQIKNHHMTKYNNLFGNLQQQVHSIQIFSKIQEVRKHTLQLNCPDKNLPGGQTP